MLVLVELGRYVVKLNAGEELSTSPMLRQKPSRFASGGYAPETAVDA